MKRGPIGDDPQAVIQLMNSLCSTVLIYAAVTRASLGLARVLESLASRTRG
jgi:hypothetical protein